MLRVPWKPRFSASGGRKMRAAPARISATPFPSLEPRCRFGNRGRAALLDA